MTDEALLRWHTVSHAFQMGNIYTEIARAHDREKRGEMDLRQSALERALDMLDATLEDPRWIHLARLREITRLREFVAGHMINDKNVPVSLLELAHLCFPFALAARS